MRIHFFSSLNSSKHFSFRLPHVIARNRKQKKTLYCYMILLCSGNILRTTFTQSVVCTRSNDRRTTRPLRVLSQKRSRRTVVGRQDFGNHENTTATVMDRWTGRVVVVTGASSGIGRSLTIALSAYPLKIVALDRNMALLQVVYCNALFIIFFFYTYQLPINVLVRFSFTHNDCDRRVSGQINH